MPHDLQDGGKTARVGARCGVQHGAMPARCHQREGLADRDLYQVFAEDPDLLAVDATAGHRLPLNRQQPPFVPGNEIKHRLRPFAEGNCRRGGTLGLPVLAIWVSRLGAMVDRVEQIVATLPELTDVTGVCEAAERRLAKGDAAFLAELGIALAERSGSTADQVWQ